MKDGIEHNHDLDLAQDNELKEEELEMIRLCVRGDNDMMGTMGMLEGHFPNRTFNYKTVKYRFDQEVRSFFFFFEVKMSEGGWDVEASLFSLNPKHQHSIPSQLLPGQPPSRRAEPQPQRVEPGTTTVGDTS